MHLLCESRGLKNPEKLDNEKKWVHYTGNVIKLRDFFLQAHHDRAKCEDIKSNNDKAYMYAAYDETVSFMKAIDALTKRTPIYQRKRSANTQTYYTQTYRGDAGIGGTVEMEYMAGNAVRAEKDGYQLMSWKMWKTKK